MNILSVAEIYRRYSESRVSDALHPNDVMYKSGADWYFPVGASGVECILSALTLTRLSEVRRILDLPCGHGRVGRHLRCAFPHAELHFCDLDVEAANFCASEFDGHPVYSVPDLTKATLPKDLDIIWIGSLFTHLSRDQTLQWLTFLAGHLRPLGILVASFHGYFTRHHPPRTARVDIEKLRCEFDATGYGFENYPSEDPVKLERYGFSMSKPSAILDMANAIPKTRVIAYIERGWASNHDVLALTRDDRLQPFAS